ncbi:MAG: sulfatase-like hydrolase/transferase [Acidobacteria bacterium]|nr:sulfatase-like hydrolase/transferase [Acidobacteriota bacterium]NIM61387.1 sulfatase-like hydrolase/transferase [Acidobacteriota bacterium]NIO58071.1 sulfatase-like hydrolase/transferase [Acidobacteriota bacterium]NIQ29080.1 sulfatase-like hydrolase/transferase [Acidobacteriota bacterium]NIQ83624.1 sulfatase-like hydrolase/transferase [Acidobacteriota bacterium]
MARSTILKVLLAVALTVGGIACGGSDRLAEPGSAAGMNVLVITIDTLRADRLGCYGHAGAETPVIDALAQTGLLFEQATTVSPITLPSHASIFTGINIPDHGVRHNGTFRLGPENTTLAERFAASGYDTAAFISAFVLDRRFGLNQGFADYDDRFERVLDPGPGSYAERPADAVTARAMGWLQARANAQRDNPFFAWVHYFDPHGPYEPPSPFAERFSSVPYDGEIAFVDHELGRLIEALRQLGALEDTLILLTSDHGEGLGEHDEATHGDLIYDSTMRVPWILSNPRLFPKGKLVRDRLAATIDIAPTIAAMTGIEMNARVDGVDLTATPIKGRTVYLETLAPLLDYGWAPLHGLRRIDSKFIQAPQPEFYDLITDPAELNNLFESRKAAGGLRAELTELMGRWPDAFEVAGIRRELTQEEQQRLASLGYVTGQGVQPPGTRDPKKMMPVWHRINQAARLSVRGEHDDAIAAIREVLTVDPGDGKAWSVAMQIYDRAGQYSEAETCARRALELRPTSDLWVNLARFALNRGDLATFDGALAEAARLDPQNGGIHIGHGHAAALAGDYEKAREEFEEAIEVDPVGSGAAAREQLRRLDALLEQRKN